MDCLGAEVLGLPLVPEELGGVILRGVPKGLLDGLKLNTLLITGIIGC
jgi:hypothetical protein